VDYDLAGLEDIVGILRGSTRSWLQGGNRVSGALPIVGVIGDRSVRSKAGVTAERLPTCV